MSSWVEVPGTRYALALDGGRLVCRGSRGKVLATLPRKARDSDTARALFELRTFLASHERACLAQVERWMLQALPVSASVLGSVWPDPAWRSALIGAVVAPVAHGAQVAQEEAGLLMDVAEAGQARVLTSNGEHALLDAPQINILHPLLMEDRAGFTALAEREGVSQGLDQLTRLCVEVPKASGDGAVRLWDYQGLRFEDRTHARAVCREVGCGLKGAQLAVVALREGGQLVEARLWLGPSQGTPVTGELVWADEKGHAMSLADVGLVAWSEGHRMARRIWAACGEPWGEGDV